MFAWEVRYERDDSPIPQWVSDHFFRFRANRARKQQLELHPERTYFVQRMPDHGTPPSQRRSGGFLDAVGDFLGDLADGGGN